MLMLTIQPKDDAFCTVKRKTKSNKKRNSVNGSCVVKACKTGRAYHGFHWKYIEDEVEDREEE